ncbi:MAG: EAL domain-containing protein [Gammaproteobacteria bacterium]|nr:EAL domain-containing protein [Gammaproteobacteria bacterium]
MNLHPVPIAVFSRRPDDAEAISQTLRNAGCMANCIILPDTLEFGEQIRTHRPVLLFVFDKDVSSPRFKHVIEMKNKHLPDVPVLAVQARVTEESIAAAMEAGASDLVSMGNKARLQAVAKREILHCQQSRQLHETEESAHHLEEQIATLVKESPDALLHVHEGIIIAINPVLVEFLDYNSESDLIGTPALDIFDAKGHAAFKGALVACSKRNWSGHTLELKMLSSDSTTLPVLVELENAMFDDEPCVRVSIKPNKIRDQRVPVQFDGEGEQHPLTGFYRRRRFLAEMKGRLAQTSQAGIWVLAYIKPDNFHRVREQLGPISSDDLLLEFAKILQGHARKSDLYGQFGGDIFMVLMPRGTLRDASAWAENLRNDLKDQLFEIGDKSLSISCTAGLAPYRPQIDEISDLVLRAQGAYQKGHRRGGDKVCQSEEQVEDGERPESDALYVQKIKTALMRDTFRLVFQPVASLDNQAQQLFDVLLRMTDEDNRELMPNVFLPTAKRNGLMKTIDRWVIANAIKFCKHQATRQLFVRLSYQSIGDITLPDWIAGQMEQVGIDPQQLIFEVTESDCENHLREVKELTSRLKAAQCRVAIEHFGVGTRPLQILEHVVTDFVKIDGSLMEGLVTNERLQRKIKSYVKVATGKNIATVAERVEDANTMAVLWQIGFQYIQGFYVQGPEEIVLGS